MSNLNLNKVVLAGRLTHDPELKQTGTGISVLGFSIAINRRRSGEGEQQTDFISCQAWRNTAEFIAKYFSKGSAICVTGAIQTRSWTDNQGQKRYATEVVVDEAIFVDSRQEQSETATQGFIIPNTTAYAPKYVQQSINPVPFKGREDDDDLPF